MTSKDGTFEAKKQSQGYDAIFFAKTKAPVCTIVSSDMVQWIYTGYFNPKILGELLEFIEDWHKKRRLDYDQ